MPTKREFRWTKETKRAEAEETKAVALAIIDQERRASVDKAARLKALRLAREEEAGARAPHFSPAASG